MNKDNKKFVVDSIFIKESLKNNLSLNDFLLLLYFDNSFDGIFNLDLIQKLLGLNQNDVLTSYSNLLKKKLIKTIAVKNCDGKIIEKVCLDEFYKDLTIENNKELKKDEKEDIFCKFEKILGKTLSPMDYEIINAWLEHGFDEDIILKALREAINNGVSSLRYIDKILYEWNRKAVKEDNESLNDLSDTNEFKIDKSLLDYDWLDEN